MMPIQNKAQGSIVIKVNTKR